MQKDYSLNLIINSISGSINGNFDTRLSTYPCDAFKNAELLLEIYLDVKPVSPPLGRNSYSINFLGKKPVTIRKWEKREWANWIAKFEKINYNYWDKKFFLINKSTTEDPYFYIIKNGIRYAPNINCKLKININTDRSMHVATNKIEVAKLDASEPVFRSSMRKMTDRDIYPRSYPLSDGSIINQVPVVHEFGHLIGLQHPKFGTAGCASHDDSNLIMCYGNEKDGSIRSVMGAGSQLLKEHALPWLAALHISTYGSNLPSVHHVKFTSTYKKWDVSRKFVHPRVI